MNRFLAGTTSALVVSFGFMATAFAADLGTPAPAPVYTKAPPLQIFSWSGFYIGADVGGAWARQDVTSSPSVATNQAPSAATLNGSSVLAGAYAGYNWQVAPSWVVGLEGDFSWTHLNDSATAPNLFADGTPVGSGGVTWSHDVKWLATARARLGYTIMPTTLVYATGGAAWAGTDYAATDAFAGGCPNCDVASPFSTTHMGWVAGAGLEWAFNRNWLVRAEYLYYRIEDASATATFPTNSSSVVNFNWADLSIQTARVGLAYKF
jgi:outer membrane immunogenic protein